MSLSVFLLQRSSLNQWQTTLGRCIELQDSVISKYMFSSMKAVEAANAPNCISRVSDGLGTGEAFLFLEI